MADNISLYTDKYLYKDMCNGTITDDGKVLIGKSNKEELMNNLEIASVPYIRNNKTGYTLLFYIDKFLVIKNDEFDAAVNNKKYFNYNITKLYKEENDTIIHKALNTEDSIPQFALDYSIDSLNNKSILSGYTLRVENKNKYDKYFIFLYSFLIDAFDFDWNPRLLYKKYVDKVSFGTASVDNDRTPGHYIVSSPMDNDLIEYSYNLDNNEELIIPTNKFNSLLNVVTDSGNNIFSEFTDGIQYTEDQLDVYSMPFDINDPAFNGSGIYNSICNRYKISYGKKLFSGSVFPGKHLLMINGKSTRSETFFKSMCKMGKDKIQCEFGIVTNLNNCRLKISNGLVEFLFEVPLAAKSKFVSIKKFHYRSYPILIKKIDEDVSIMDNSDTIDIASHKMFMTENEKNEYVYYSDLPYLFFNGIRVRERIQPLLFIKTMDYLLKYQRFALIDSDLSCTINT